MGNQESLSPPSNNSKINHYQLTETQSPKMFITININSQTQDLTPFLAKQEQRIHIYEHQNIFMPKFVRVINDGMCNDSCEALFEAQPYFDCLYDQIQKRRSIGRYYSHEEIWFLLGVVVKTAAEIHQYGNKWIIGNIHPKNILINEEGMLKIISQSSLPYENDHFVEYCQKGGESAFISPQTIGFMYNSAISKSEFPSCVDRQQSQAFCLGMTILSLTTLKLDLSQIYDTSFYFQFPLDPKTKKHAHTTSNKTTYSQVKSNINQPHSFRTLLNSSYIHQQLEFIRKNYCEVLSEIVKKLLIADPQERLSIRQLYQQVIWPNYKEIQGMELDWLSGIIIQKQSYNQYYNQNSLSEFESRYY